MGLRLMNVKKKFLICPTYRMGVGYLREKGRFADWTILTVDTDTDVVYKVRGCQNYEAEKIVTTEYEKTDRLQELEETMKHLNITITPVGY